MKTNDYDLEPLFYCGSCLSLNIQTKNNQLYCAACGAKAEKIDVTSIDKWQALYRAKYGCDFVSKPTTIYDDLPETYYADSYATLDETEALRNGLIVRDCVNLRWKDC